MGYALAEAKNGTRGLEDFRHGLTRLRDDKLEDALAYFQHAAEEDPGNPFYISYKGLLLAKVSHRWADAEELCTEAVKLNRNHAQLYLNLAEVYLSAGRRADALETLNKGLLYNARDLRLHHELEKLGTRRPPVIPFLSRENFLNRNLGRLRHSIAPPL